MANVSSCNGLEKYPKLRFPGFEEPWKPTAFGELVCEFSERTKVEDEDTLLSAAIEGMFLNTELFGHQRGASNKGYKKIRRGTMVLSTQNLHLGNANVNLRFAHGMVSPAYKTYEIKGCSVDLIAQWIKSEAAKRFFYNATTVGASVCRRNVEWETLYEQALYLPSIAEQEKIAGLLTLLSNRISKQQQFVAALKKYKRGAVRTLLTPESCKIEGAKWNYAQIGELGTFVKGAPLSKADIATEGTPFILYGELYTTYNEVISEVVRKTQAAVEPQYFSKVGDVILPTSGETPEEISTASCVMVPNVILAGDLYIFRSTKIDGRIMSYILNHIANGAVARVAQGKSIVHVQASEISKIRIAYPDIETQQKIITVFDALNAMIDRNQKVLVQLELQRKAMLQRLFI